MSEVLLGVILGGLIGSIAPVAQIVQSQLQWKRDARLSLLKERRGAMEAKIAGIVAGLSEALQGDTISSDLTSDIEVLLAGDASKIFDMFLSHGDLSPEARRAFHFEMTMALKRALAALDGEIDEMLR